ncbi:MAG: hypothetical protein ACK56F_26255, partial [bacterium]
LAPSLHLVLCNSSSCFRRAAGAAPDQSRSRQSTSARSHSKRCSSEQKAPPNSRTSAWMIHASERGETF